PDQDDSANTIGGQCLHGAGHRQIGLACAGGTDSESQIATADLREIVALVSATRANPSTRHTHGVLMLVGIAHNLSGLPLLQSEMYAFGRDLFFLRSEEHTSELQSH